MSPHYMDKTIYMKGYTINKNDTLLYSRSDGLKPSYDDDDDDDDDDVPKRLK